MANGEAVTQASHLGDIGFPEFTTKLITDVFDALVGANIRQTESYIELISAVGEGLTEYINKTKDDIGGDEILQFLAKAVPPTEEEPNEDKRKIEEEAGTKIIKENTISVDEASALKDALRVDADISDEVVPDPDGGVVTITEEAYPKLLEAVAKRIAANKYTLLEKMVQQGILRLVVENGLIETRLTFSAYDSSFYQTKSNTYNRSTYKSRSKARTGGLLSLFMKAGGSTTRTSLTVSTAEKVNQDRSGTSVNIFGRVQINFKTDYLPLNE